MYLIKPCALNLRINKKRLSEKDTIFFNILEFVMGVIFEDSSLKIKTIQTRYWICKKKKLIPSIQIRIVIIISRRDFFLRYKNIDSLYNYIL